MRHCCKIRIQKNDICNILGGITPCAMAILQSASLSARTSLTPSPVIATVCPWPEVPVPFLSSAAVLHVRTHCILQLHPSISSVVDRCRIYIVIGIFKSCTFGNRRNRHRIITGDNFKVNSWLSKNASVSGASSRITSVISNSPPVQGLRKFCSLCPVWAMSKNKNTKSFLCKSLHNSSASHLPSFRKKELCCSHKIGARFFKNGSAVFPV